MNLLNEGVENISNEHLYSANANEIDEKKPKLKDLTSHLEYAYLHNNKSFLVIISSKLSKKEKRLLLQVLEKYRGAIAWKMSDIKEISPSFSTHKILMEDNFKPVIQPERHLNPKVQDVVKNEFVKLLDSGLIYPISDSSWVSPIHVVPKEGGMTVVLNDNTKLIPSRTVTGWRFCIDNCKLNDATRKDHFPLSFIDQMLERLSRNEYYCFLDGFSRFFQIPIAPEDQENATLTCLYGTFSYRRMSFGLCNVPATFQRCMTEIFHDMVEDLMEVFMDDFSVFDFMGPFPYSRGNKYILIAIDYGSKWIEDQALPTNDDRVVVKFLRGLFSRFGVPKSLISDRGTHFCNSQLERSLQKYGVTHRLSTAYHPQSNGQTEVTNMAIKRILERSVGYNPKDWSEKLNDALWAFMTTYKTPTGCTPFRLVYGKACHLPVESKLKSKWYMPNIVKTVYPYGTIEITDKIRFSFKVNGQRLKKYYEGNIDNEEEEVVEFVSETT
ncbi:reverse transcriptase domain-containing protein [Tanacetum coccineum]